MPLRTHLNLEALETREVPAVVSAFNPHNGRLVVRITDNGAIQNVWVGANTKGQVLVNNVTVANPAGGKVASAKVRSLVVNGSELANNIDLRITTQRFHHIAITVNARGGDDEIEGSVFADVINGGAGDDFLYGGDGNDTLNGGAGNDGIAGDGGNDTLYGEAGQDRLDGRAGTDTLYGGSEKDVFDGGPDAGDTAADVESGLEPLGYYSVYECENVLFAS